MPFTPFHLGPALLLGLIFFSYLDFPTFIVANVIVDVEPFIIIALGLDLPLHGFLHSFLGGTIVSFLLAFSMIRIGKLLMPITRLFHLEQKQSIINIFSAALSGVYLHIVLDSRLYKDIKPFYPLVVNPLFSGKMFAVFDVYSLCVISALVGIALYLWKIR
jgi:hypothetical protein